MSLRIQCPACQRQFTVDEELKGRTVECGSCEKQFIVDKDSVIRERDRYFPGDIKKPGLKHYGVAPSQSESKPRVDFATALYSEAASAADVIPPAPGRTIAGIAGMVILLVYLVALVFGWMGQGFLRFVVQKVILKPGQWEGAHRNRQNQIWIMIKGGIISAKKNGQFEYQKKEILPGAVGWLEPNETDSWYEKGNEGDVSIEYILVTLK